MGIFSVLRDGAITTLFEKLATALLGSTAITGAVYAAGQWLQKPLPGWAMFLIFLLSVLALLLHFLLRASISIGKPHLLRVRQSDDGTAYVTPGLDLAIVLPVQKAGKRFAASFPPGRHFWASLHLTNSSGVDIPIHNALWVGSCEPSQQFGRFSAKHLILAVYDTRNERFVVPELSSASKGLRFTDALEASDAGSLLTIHHVRESITDATVIVKTELGERAFFVPIDDVLNRARGSAEVG